MSETTFRHDVARLNNLSTGDARAMIERAVRAMNATERATYGHHLERAAELLDRAADLDAQRIDPKSARFTDAAHAANDRHDGAAGDLYRYLDLLLTSPLTTDADRATAQVVRDLFFVSGRLEDVVTLSFREQTENSAALVRAWRASGLEDRAAAVPLLGEFVAAFVAATEELVATVHDQRESEVTYAQVRDANHAANERLREFAWHVAGTLTSADPESAARRDAILAGYFELIREERRRTTPKARRAAEAAADADAAVAEGGASGDPSAESGEGAAE